jgi:uncharacterized RDD family membrane protein YckC
MNTATLQIKTPEGIVFSQTLASPIARFLACVVDQLCVMVLMALVQTTLLLLSLISADFMTAIQILLYFGVTIGFGIMLEWRWRGQTIGKRMLRLRVVDAEGMRLTFSQIVIRNLLRFVDLLPGLYLLGGATALFTRKAQRLGDFAANTVVIRIPKISSPDIEKVLPDKFNSLRDHPHLCARLRQRVTPAEASIALQALIRRDDFEATARVQLFEELAVHFKSKVEFPAEATADMPDEQYVRNVADVLFRPDAKSRAQNKAAA